jgi:KilA-N domain
LNILTFRDHQISQRTDGFVNLTQMAKANSKRLDVYLKTKETRSYLKAAQESIYHQMVVNGEVVQATGFGRNKQTWGHPLVALHLAQWISPEFHLWCNRHIKTLIETGETKISSIATEPLTGAETVVKMANELLAQERRLTGAEGTIKVVQEDVKELQVQVKMLKNFYRRVRSGLELRLDIEAVLCDPVLQNLPNTKIAVICGCSESMIRKYKDERVGIFRTKKTTKEKTKVQVTIDVEVGEN